jgi:hypothetical protein
VQRLLVHLNKKLVMTVHKRVLKKKKVVYLLTTANPIKYKFGRSKVVYIGTTKKGVGRIAGSAAGRAEKIMSGRGLKELNVFVVSCSPHPGVPSWKRLEDALLAIFLSEYHELPMCNDHGKKKRFNEELQSMFKRPAIEKVLNYFDPSK